MTFVKAVVFCCILHLTIIAVHAETYKGRVVDAESESPLAGVQVSLLNSSIRTTTDSLGRFSISADLAVKYNRIVLGGRNTLRWLDAVGAFDVGSAPEVESITLYNLKGERLFHSRRAPGANRLSLPALSRNIYLVRIATAQQVFSLQWVYLGKNHAFSFGVQKKPVAVLPKQQAIVSLMMFEGQGYQTKRVDIDSDSTYDSMYVKMKPEIGDYIFFDDTVRTYRLYFSKTDMDALLDFGKLVSGGFYVNSVYVPARLECEDRKLDSVAVRFRGDQSLWEDRKSVV
jgi:hypothetical protein